MLEVLDKDWVLRWATENAGRVERRDDGCPGAGEQFAVLLEHEEVTPPGDRPNGGPAEGHDHVPGAGFDLTSQTPMTGEDGPSRWPTVGWTAGDRVGDEEFPFEEPSLVGGPPEDGARCAPERLSLDDLLGARRLADEDDAARWVAAWADSRAEAVRTAETRVDGRHSASVARR